LFWKFFSRSSGWRSWPGSSAVVSLFWLTGRSESVLERHLLRVRWSTFKWVPRQRCCGMAGAEAFRNWSEARGGELQCSPSMQRGRDLLGRLVPFGVAAEDSPVCQRIGPNHPGSARFQGRGWPSLHIIRGGPWRRPTGWACWRRGPPLRYRLHPSVPPNTDCGGRLAASIFTALLLAGYVAKPIRSLRAGL